MKNGPPARPGDIHVFGRRVVVGTGRTVLPNSVVTVRDGIITRVGPPIADMAPYGNRVFPTLMPGLVDAHVHLAFAAGTGFRPLGGEEAVGAAAATALATMQRLLAHGITTVRDLGSPAGALPLIRAAVDADRTAFPRLFGAGRAITTPGGHLADVGLPVISHDEATAAIDANVADSADTVKVIVTGGRYTPGTPMGRATMSHGLLRHVVTTAHAAALPVAAHVHGTEGIGLAMRAGVDTLEHCSWVDCSGRVRRPVAQLLDRMREDGQTIVTAGPLSPELIDWASAPGGDWRSVADFRRTRRQLALWRNAATARARGVRVAIGTDSLFGGCIDDVDLLLRAELMTSVGGWESLDVLESLTGAGGAAIGHADRVGVLSPGAAADLLAVDGDPLVDVHQLRRAALVMRAGVVVHDRQPAGGLVDDGAEFIGGDLRR